MQLPIMKFKNIKVLHIMPEKYAKMYIFYSEWVSYLIVWVLLSE